MDAAADQPVCIAEEQSTIRLIGNKICFQGRFHTLDELRSKLEQDKTIGVTSWLLLASGSPVAEYGVVMEVLNLLRQFNRTKVGLLTGKAN